MASDERSVPDVPDDIADLTDAEKIDADGLRVGRTEVREGRTEVVEGIDDLTDAEKIEADGLQNQATDIVDENEQRR
jgi:hypothetical protein